MPFRGAIIAVVIYITSISCAPWHPVKTNLYGYSYMA
jgi:hypothetical protein